jgi:hypothetical protein
MNVQLAVMASLLNEIEDLLGHGGISQGPSYVYVRTAIQSPSHLGTSR